MQSQLSPLTLDCFRFARNDESGYNAPGNRGFIHNAQPAIRARRVRHPRASPWRSARTAARCRGGRWWSGLRVTFALALLMLKVPQTEIAFDVDQSTRSMRSPPRPGPAPRSCSAMSAAAPLPFDVKDAGARFHSRLPGAAGRAGDERAVVAAVLLAHHAADRARLFLGAGKDARRRRRRGAVDRGQYFRRPGRGAAVHPAVSGAAVAQRNVHRHDRRHGRHRRHRVRALCDDPRHRDPGRRRPYRGLLGARRAGGDPHQPHHGARP